MAPRMGHMSIRLEFFFVELEARNNTKSSKLADPSSAGPKHCPNYKKIVWFALTP
jgi:hypothetical protein